MNSINNNYNMNNDKSSNKSYYSKKLVIAPTVCALISFIIISFSYIYEKNINKHVLSLEKRAQNLALSGDLSTALITVKENIKKRPNYTCIQTDLEFLINGIEIKKQLDVAKEFQNLNQTDKAFNIILNLEEQISNSTGPFYSVLKNDVLNAKDILLVNKIKKNIRGKYTIQELIPYYSMVCEIESLEGQILLENLKSEISRIAYANASFYLNKNNFNAALKELNTALKYDSDNQKLLSFKNIIIKKRQKLHK